MENTRKIYWVLTALSLAGYAWLAFAFLQPDSQADANTVCVFKNVTGLPCVSCGITRAIVLLLNGDITHALWINPLGGIAALALLIIPPWIGFDLTTKKNTLASLFLWTERKIKTKKVIYIPLVALALLNWGWNILKDL